MGNIKAKTLLEQLGFVDIDKKNLNHDKIQTWVYDNFETVFYDLFSKDNPIKIAKKIWEFDISKIAYNGVQIVGFIDLVFECDYIKEYTKRNVYVEIKTAIPSVGELLRQLKAYKTYLGLHYTDKFIVVCPDDTYEKIIKEQGYFFYKYKDPSKLF